MYSLLLAVPDSGGGGGGGGGSGNLLILLLPLLLIFLLMPLFNKKEKKRRARMKELKKHDKVVTTGGIYGTVVSLDEVSATIEVAKDVRIRIKRTSIFDNDTPQEAKAKAEQPARKAGARS